MCDAQVEFIVSLYRRLRTAFPDVSFRGRIGVISPYRQQISELRRR